MSGSSNQQLIARLKHLREILASGYISPSPSPPSKKTKRSKSSTSPRNKTSTKTTKKSTNTKITTKYGYKTGHGTTSSVSKSKYEKELQDFQVDLTDKFEKFLKEKKSVRVSPDQSNSKNKKSSKQKSSIKRSSSTKKSTTTLKRNQKNYDSNYNETSYKYNNEEFSKPKATITKITSVTKTITREKDKPVSQSNYSKNFRSQTTSSNTRHYDINDIPPPINKQHSNKLNSVTNTKYSTKIQNITNKNGIENDYNFANIKNKYTYTNPPPQLLTKSSTNDVNSTYRSKSSNKSFNANYISSESDSNDVNILKNRRYLQNRNISSDDGDDFYIKAITKNYKTPAPVINNKKKNVSKDKNSQTVIQKIIDDETYKKKSSKLNVSKKIDFSDSKKIIPKNISSDSESFDVSKYTSKKTSSPIDSTKTKIMSTFETKKLMDFSDDDEDDYIKNIKYKGENVTKPQEIISQASRTTKTAIASKTLNLSHSSSSDDLLANKKSGKTTMSYATTVKTTTVNGPTSKGKAIYQISSSSSDDLEFNKVLNKTKNTIFKSSNVTSTTSTTAPTGKFVPSLSTSSSTDDLLKSNKNVASKIPAIKNKISTSNSSESIDFEIKTKTSSTTKPSFEINKKNLIDSDDDDDLINKGLTKPKLTQSKDSSPSSSENFANKIKKEFLDISGSSDDFKLGSTKQPISSSNKNSKLSPVNTKIDTESDESDNKNDIKTETKFKLTTKINTNINSSSSDTDFYLDKKNQYKSPINQNKPISNILDDSSDTSEPLLKKNNLSSKFTNGIHTNFSDDSSDVSDLDLGKISSNKKIISSTHVLNTKISTEKNKKDKQKKLENILKTIDDYSDDDTSHAIQLSSDSSIKASKQTNLNQSPPSPTSPPSISHSDDQSKPKSPSDFISPPVIDFNKNQSSSSPVNNKLFSDDSSSPMNNKPPISQKNTKLDELDMKPPSSTSPSPNSSTINNDKYNKNQIPVFNMNYKESNSDSSEELHLNVPDPTRYKPAQPISPNSLDDAGSDSDFQPKPNMNISMESINKLNKLKLSPPVEVHSPERNSKVKRNIKEVIVQAPDFGSESESLNEKIKQKINQSRENNQLSDSDNDAYINISTNISSNNKSQKQTSLNSFGIHDINSDLNDDNLSSEFNQSEYKNLPVIDVSLTDTQVEAESNDLPLNDESSTDTHEEVVYSKKFHSSSNKNNLFDSDLDDNLNNRQLYKSTTEKKTINSIPILSSSDDDSGFDFQIQPTKEITKTSKTTEISKNIISNDDSDSSHEERMKMLEIQIKKEEKNDLLDSSSSSPKSRKEILNNSVNLLDEGKLSSSGIDDLYLPKTNLNKFTFTQELSSSNKELTTNDTSKKNDHLSLLSDEDSDNDINNNSSNKLFEKMIKTNKGGGILEESSSDEDTKVTVSSAAEKILLDDDSSSLHPPNRKVNDNLFDSLSSDIIKPGMLSEGGGSDTQKDLLKFVNNNLEGSSSDDDNFNLKIHTSKMTVSSTAEKILLDDGSSSLYPPNPKSNDKLFNSLSSENENLKSNINISDSSDEEINLKNPSKNNIVSSEAANIIMDEDSSAIFQSKSQTTSNFVIQNNIHNSISSNKKLSITDSNNEEDSDELFKQELNKKGNIGEINNNDSLVSPSKRNTISSDAEKILLEEDSSAVFQSKSKNNTKKVINNEASFDSSSSEAFKGKTNILAKENSEDDDDDDEYKELIKNITNLTSQNKISSDHNEIDIDDGKDLSIKQKTNLSSEEGDSSKAKDGLNNLLGSSSSNISKRKKENYFDKYDEDEDEDEDVDLFIKKNRQSNILDYNDDDENNLTNPNKITKTTNEYESSSSKQNVDMILSSSLTNISQKKQNITIKQEDDEDEDENEDAKESFIKQNNKFNILDDSADELNLDDQSKKMTSSSETENIFLDKHSSSTLPSKANNQILNIEIEEEEEYYSSSKGIANNSIKSANKISDDENGKEENDDLLNKSKQNSIETKEQLQNKDDLEDDININSFALYTKSSAFSKNPENVVDDSDSDDKDDLLLQINSVIKSNSQSRQENTNQTSKFTGFSSDEENDILNHKQYKTTETTITSNSNTKLEINVGNDETSNSKEQAVITNKNNPTTNSTKSNNKYQSDSDESDSMVKYLMDDSNSVEIFKFDDNQSSDEEPVVNENHPKIQQNKFESHFSKLEVNKQMQNSMEENEEEEDNFQFEIGPISNNTPKQTQINEEEEEYDNEINTINFQNNKINDEEEDDDDINQFVKTISVSQKVETKVIQSSNEDRKDEKKVNLSQEIKSTKIRNPYDDFTSDDSLAETNSGSVIDFNLDNVVINDTNNTEIANIIDDQEEEESAIPIYTKQYNSSINNDELDFHKITQKHESFDNKEILTTVTSQKSTEKISLSSNKQTNDLIGGIDSDSDIIDPDQNLDDIKTSSSDEDDEKIQAMKKNIQEKKDVAGNLNSDDDEIINNEQKKELKINQNVDNILNISENFEEEDDLNLSEIDRLLQNNANGDNNDLSMKKNSTINLKIEEDDDDSYDNINDFKPQTSSELGFTYSAEIKSQNSDSIKKDSLNETFKIDNIIDEEENIDESIEDLVQSNSIINNQSEKANININKLRNAEMSDQSDNEDLNNDNQKKQSGSNFNVCMTNDDDDDDDDELLDDPELRTLKERIQKQRQKPSEESVEMNKEEEEEIMQIISNRSKTTNSDFKIDLNVNMSNDADIDVNILVSDSEGEEEEEKGRVSINQILKVSDKLNVPLPSEKELKQTLRNDVLIDDEEEDTEILNHKINQIEDEDEDEEEDIDIDIEQLKLINIEEEEEEDENVF